MGHSWPLFVNFVFSTVSSTCVHYYKLFPLTGFELLTSSLEATALPTEPPPRPTENDCFFFTFALAVVTQRFEQCDQLRRFFKVLGNKMTSKRNPNDWQLFGLFWKTSLLCNYFFSATFWAPLWKMGYFLHQHLVTIQLFREGKNSCCLPFEIGSEKEDYLFHSCASCKPTEPTTNKKVSNIACSVTRFGDFLDFGQLFKAFGSN